MQLCDVGPMSYPLWALRFATRSSDLREGLTFRCFGARKGQGPGFSTWGCPWRSTWPGPAPRRRPGSHLSRGRREPGSEVRSALTARTVALRHWCVSLLPLRECVFSKANQDLSGPVAQRTRQRSPRRPPSEQRRPWAVCVWGPVTAEAAEDRGVPSLGSVLRAPPRFPGERSVKALIRLVARGAESTPGRAQSPCLTCARTPVQRTGPREQAAAWWGRSFQRSRVLCLARHHVVARALGGRSLLQMRQLRLAESAGAR